MDQDQLSQQSLEKKPNKNSKGLVIMIVIVSLVTTLTTVFLWEVTLGDQMRIIRLENKVKMLEVDVEDLNKKTGKINIVK